jgi:hypothetical protein
MGVYSTNSAAADPSATSATFTSYSRAWNGKTWSAPVQIDSYSSDPQEGNYNVIQDVTCTSSAFCMALGGHFGSAVWNGHAWHVSGGQTTGTDGGTGVACTSANFCLATPAAPNTVTWNGKTWGATQQVPDTEGWLSSPGCISTTKCYATAAANTQSGQYPYSFNGSTWTLGAADDTPASAVLSCAAVTYCVWGSNDAAGVSVLNGSTWSAPVTLEPDASTSIDAVSCTTTFCVATIGASTFIFSDTTLGKPLSVAPATATGPVFGSTAWTASLPNDGIGVEGFGQVAPTTIDLGGTSAEGGYIHSIKWSTWGQGDAIGTGSSLYVTNSSLPMSDQPDEPTTVVAYDLGTCGSGPAYTMFNWYYPTEGETGPDSSTAFNACTGTEVGAALGGLATTGSSGNTGSGPVGNSGAAGNTGALANTGSTGNTGNS